MQYRTVALAYLVGVLSAIVAAVTTVCYRHREELLEEWRR